MNTATRETYVLLCRPLPKSPADQKAWREVASGPDFDALFDRSAELELQSAVPLETSIVARSAMAAPRASGALAFLAGPTPAEIRLALDRVKSARRACGNPLADLGGGEGAKVLLRLALGALRAILARAASVPEGLAAEVAEHAPEVAE